MKAANTPSHHDSSVFHRQQLGRGLTVEWFRTTGGSTDSDWSVVRYNDGSTWLFSNGDPEPLEIYTTVGDGLNRSLIYTTSTGAIIALYEDGPQCFTDSDAWMDSLSESDKAEAVASIL